jgi:ceramide glucosyltransferase
LAGQWEAIGANCDFWSQVLQARDLGSLKFGLGAAMAMRKSWLEAAGGWAPLGDFLADDYQLGRRIALAGGRVELSPVVVACRERTDGWRQALSHQLRWARAIRFSRPVAFGFSVLANATVWPLVWFAYEAVRCQFAGRPDERLVGASLWAGLALGIRMVAAVDLQRRFLRRWPHISLFWLAWFKDLLGVAVWAAAWAGNRVEWAGRIYRVERRGRIVQL